MKSNKMKEKIICGIQQLGIGVPKMHEAWAWYKKYFGFDVRIFEEAAIAEYMLPYTGGKPRMRHAALAMNLQGGGGFEIWQYADRTPKPVGFEIQLGDLGIFAGKIKSANISAAFNWLKEKGQNILGGMNDDNGYKHFFVKDPLGNLFQIVPSSNWFQRGKKLTGGTYGAIIGVSNMDKSIPFYQEILHYDQIVSDRTGVFDDFKELPGGNQKVRRVILRHSEPRRGAFSPLFGQSQLELVQTLDRKPRKIFENRYWGDLGFIHLCFDIRGMALLRKECQDKGHPFTVDAGDNFDMGEAAGSFSYIEDPDGALIEFVETHKVPIVKKLGWYLNLRKRDPKKSLPRWMLKAMGFNKASDIGK